MAEEEGIMITLPTAFEIKELEDFVKKVEGLKGYKICGNTHLLVLDGKELDIEKIKELKSRWKAQGR